MSIRAARVPILVAAGLICLGAGLSGCAGWKRVGDTASLNNPAGESAKSGDTTTGTAAGDTTGSIVTQPAEPGPSGEPVAPLSKPGLLGDDPNDDVQLGKKYFRSNNFGLAEASFRSAAVKHPNDAEAWIGLAASYDRLRRFDLADRAYAEAIRVIGPTVEILNDQGFSYMLRGDYARAHRLLLQAQAKDPDNRNVQANLQLLDDSIRQRKAVQ